MKQREELDAAGRIKSLEAVKAELAERQAEIDAELTKLLQQLAPSETGGQSTDPRRWIQRDTAEQHVTPMERRINV